MLLYEEMEERIKARLSSQRYLHTIGVVKAAEGLAKRYGEDIEKAKIAALVHDCAKMLDPAQLLEQAENYRLPLDEISILQPELLHAAVGSILASRDFEIEEKDIIDAVKYHTTGRANMSMLEKIIYLADYIEEGRSFPGVDILREKAKQNIDEAMLQALNNSIKYIIDRELLIHPDTFEARNDLLRMIYYNSKKYKEELNVR